MAQNWIEKAIVGWAVLIGSTLSGFAQGSGMPIISSIPYVSSEIDRGAPFFASSPAVSSSLPIAMTPNPFTGALNLSVSIAAPRAKGRVMPPLTFTYDGLRGEGTLGVGWMLTAGSITRSRRFGIDFAGTAFVLTLGSRSIDLIDVGGGVYKDKRDEFRVKADQVVGSPGVFSWLVTDAYGTKYFFGSTEESRRQVLNGTKTEISEWHLDRIEDLTDNYSTLGYQSDSGYLYLKSITFTGNTRGQLEPHNSIDVSYEPRPKQDITASFATNHESRVSLRAHSVDVRARGRLYASYVFSYSQSAETKRSLLAAISRTYPESSTVLSPQPSPTPLGSPGTGLSVPLETVAFTYANGKRPVKWAVDYQYGPTREALMNFQCLPGDFNGDGKSDLACAIDTSGGWSVGISRRAISNLTATPPGKQKFNGFDTTPWTGPVITKTLDVAIPFSGADSFHPDKVVTIPDVRSRCLTGDFNGDNADDIVCYDASNNRWQFGISTTKGFSVRTLNTGPRIVSGGNPFTIADHCTSGDFNGDGLTDIACLVSGAKDQGLWSVALTSQDGWEIADWPNGAAPPAAAGSTVSKWCRPGDFNGDGRTDIGCFDTASNTWFIALSAGGSFSTQPWSANSSNPILTDNQTIASRCLEGDFNGDGKTDFSCFKSGTDEGLPDTEGFWKIEKIGKWWTMLSTGAGWKTALWTGPTAHSGDVEVSCFVGDFSGDRKSDIACRTVVPGPLPELAGWWVESLAESDTFRPSVVKLGGFSTVGNTYLFASCLASDFDGDAKTDLLCDQGWGDKDPKRKNGYELSSTDTRDTDLLVSVRAATGLTASFEYASSSDQPMAKSGFPLPVVTQMSLNAGTTTKSTNYEYENSAFQKSAREFRGFNHLKITNSKTVNEHQRVDDIWFFQGEGLNVNEPILPSGLQDLAAGRAYKQIVSDGSNQRFASTLRYEGRALTPSAGAPQAARLVELRTSLSGDPNSNPDRIQKFDYDSDGNIVDASDRDLKTPGAAGLRIRTTFSNDSQVHALAYPLTVEVSDQTTSRLQSISYRYDEATCTAQPKPHSFLLTSLNRWIDDASTAELRFGYGSSGNLACVVDEYGGSTSLVYDSDAEYVVSKRNPLKQQTTFSYSGVDDDASPGLPGLLHTVATNTGQDVTNYEYDAVGRMTQIVKPDLSWTRISYNNVGDPSKQNVRLESSAGLAQTLYWDGLGRVYRSLGTGPSGKSVSVTKAYEPAGWLVAIDEPQLVNDPASPTPPARTRVRMEYDALGRVLAATDSTGRTSRRCYDGLQVVSLDANGHAWRTTSDGFGRPLSMEEFEGTFTSCDAVSQLPSSVTTAYTYDGIGRLQRVTKQGALVSEFIYDGLGHVRKIKNIDKGEVLFQYDLTGRVRRVDRSGKRPLEYARDSLGRLKAISTPNVCGAPGLATLLKKLKLPCGAQDLWKFGYDVGPHAEGRLTSTAAPNYEADYQYDEHGNNIGQVATIDGQTYTLSRQYDSAGRVTRVDYPDDRHVVYRYDGPVLASIIDGGRPLFVAHDFNAYGEPTRLQFGNGAVETFDYGLGGNSSAENQDQCASIPSGELCRISIDGLERLASELTQSTTTGTNNSGAPTTYAYDTLGRRTSTSFQGPYQYARDTATARPSSPTLVGATPVQSDPAGNIIRIGATRYDFDLFGQLKKVETPDHQTEYTYDWLGNLIQRKTKYTPPGDLTEHEQTTDTFPNPYLTCKKNRCDDLVIGYGGVSAKLTTDGAEYYHLDRLGTRFAVTTSDGGLKNILSYSGYGVPANTNTEDAQYAGHGWDRDSALYWFGSRFYEPAIGQFLSPDVDSWLLAGDTSPYQYAFDNPLRWIDPDGHQGGSMTISLGGGSLGGLGSGIGNMFPMGVSFPGSGLFGGGSRPNFGNGMNTNPTSPSAPAQSGVGHNVPSIDVFAFVAVGGHAPAAGFSGGVESAGLVGLSMEGPYLGWMVLGGGGAGSSSVDVSQHSGREYILDISGGSSVPITTTEVNARFIGGGRYQTSGGQPESGSFWHVSFKVNIRGHSVPVSAGIGMSDTTPSAFGYVLLRMVVPAWNMRDPRFGAGLALEPPD